MVVECPFREGLRPCLSELVEEVTHLVWRGGGRSETSQTPNSQQQSDKHESSGRGVLSLGWRATPSQVVMTLFRGHVQATCACVQGGEVTSSEAMVSSYRVASVWSTASILARSEHPSLTLGGSVSPARRHSVWLWALAHAVPIPPVCP